MKFDQNLVVFQAKWPGLPKEKVKINLSTEYNRKTCNEKIEKSLGTVFHLEKHENDRFFH